MVPSTRGLGIQLSMVVCHILGVENEEPWVVGSVLKQEQHYFQKTEITKVVQLNDYVRRAGLIHCCDKECLFRSATDVIHSKELIQGGKYQLLKRFDGFPPHLG